MTKARIQPFCRANNNNKGYYDGERVFPRSVTDRNNALFLCNNNFFEYGKVKILVFNKLLKN